MKQLWDRLAAIASRTPKSLRLRPGTTDAAIRAAEQTMGLRFPDDFRASLLVHDGQEEDDGTGLAFPWLPGHAELASLDRIVARWRVECRNFEFYYDPGEAPQPIEGDRLHHFLWHPKRLPIAGNPEWDQDNTYLDYFPGPAGVAGQVAIFGKGNYGEVHGPSFGAVLELYVRALESGEWLYRDGDCVSRLARPIRWSKYVTKKLSAR